MPDALFTVTRLARIYDDVDDDRRDLDAYVDMAQELAAGVVLDVGCGTGTLACRLAESGLQVIAVDPAVASVDVARRKRGAHRVAWIVSGVDALPPVEADLVTMTGNVAQVFVGDREWADALAACHAALPAGGCLNFEVRDPAARAWQHWTRARTERRIETGAEGPVRTWVQLTDVALPLVTFETHYCFEADGQTFVSKSTLRFRSRTELERALDRAGFVIDDVRDAADRPGLELVFVARRP